jgi:hypothetical protein
MTYRYHGWDDAERRAARRHARPFYRYHLRLLLDAVLVFAAIVVLIVITSTGYAR